MTNPIRSSALNYVEKVILAYSRTISGTVSLIASILILNKIYRCCCKKRFIYLNSRNNNYMNYYNNNQMNASDINANDDNPNINSNVNVVAATAQLSMQPQHGTPTTTDTTTNTTTTGIHTATGSGSTATTPNTNTLQLPSLQQQQPEEFVAPPITTLTATTTNNNNSLRTILLLDDDGYTPLPPSSLSSQQQHHQFSNLNYNTVNDDDDNNNNDINATMLDRNRNNNRNPQQMMPDVAGSPSPLYTQQQQQSHQQPPLTSSSSSLLSLLSYTTVYQRLLIGTSLLDILHSFWAALSTVPVPASSGVVNGYGTVTTCSIQGFFVQFSAATPIYFAALTFYFMCKVCYHTTDSMLSQRYELYFHLLPCIVAFGGGIIGVSLQLFNPIALPELGCWVAPYPVGCSITETCTRGYKIGQYSDWYAWCLAFVWFFLSFIVVVINTTMIYGTIYHRERNGGSPAHTRVRIMQQYQEHLQQPHTELPSSYGSSTVITNDSSINNKPTVILAHEDDHRNNVPGQLQCDESDNEHDFRGQQQQQQQQFHIRSNDVDDDDDDVDMDPEFLEVPMHHQRLNSTTTEANTSNDTTATRRDHLGENDNLVVDFPTTLPLQLRDGLNNEQLQQQHQQQQDRIQNHHHYRTSVRTSRIAAVQCVLYVSTALFTTVWAVMPWIGKKLSVTAQWRFFFAFMFNIFNPLQGFFTLIIFIRLQYLRLRISEPNWSRVQCIRFCLFSPDAK